MTEKRFEMVITGADGSFHYLDKNTGEKITSTLELENKLNELHDEKQSVIDWIDNKIEEIKPYNSELCRATLLELKELYK